MATADSLDQPAQARSVSRSLWQRWRARRQRNQMRYLSYGKFRLTREGVHFLAVLLFIFVGAVIREINLLTLLAGAMIGLLLLQWRFNSRTLIGLSLERYVPQHLSVGQVSDIRLRLRNPKRWLGAWLVVVNDGLQQLAPGKIKLTETGASIVDEVRPQGVSHCKYELLFHQRGLYRIGPSVISTRFPLGLGRGWRTLDNSQELIVRPRLGELTSQVRSLFQQLREGQAASSPKAGVHEADFFGLRPWQSGDSRRWIHWRTTARLGEISVRQFERQQQMQLCVLLDLHTESGLASDEACEKAVSFLGTLAMRTALQGAGKMAVAVAGRQTFAITDLQSAVLAGHLLDHLSTASASSEPDIAEALEKLLLPLVSNQTLLVVSTRPSRIEELYELGSSPVASKLIHKLKIVWLNTTAGDLDPYFTLPDEYGAPRAEDTKAS